MIQQLLTISEVRERCGHVSACSIYRWVKLGTFPKPIKVCESGAASRWIGSEIEAAIELRRGARGGAA